MIRASRRCVAAALLLVAGACDSSLTSASRPGLHVTSAGQVADTISALVAAPLTVMLRDANGAPRTGISLRMDVTTAQAPGPASPPQIAPTPAGPFSASTTVVTDASGTASAMAMLGSRAGQYFVVVRLASEGLSDSVSVTVRAGRGVELMVPQRDTAILLGRTLSLKATVLDRAGNATSGDDIRFTREFGPLTVTTTGSITGTDVGRGVVRVTAGAKSTLAAVSVVPDGVLAVYASGGGSKTSGIYTMRTDGSDGRWVYRVTEESGLFFLFGMWPTWSPDGQSIAFVENQKLRLIGQDGSSMRDVVTGGLAVSNAHGLQFSRDGQWIYFTRGQFTAVSCWRVHPDGTGLARISNTPEFGGDFSPTPSADGSRVAYASFQAPSGLLRIMASGGGLPTLAVVSGTWPRWSPAGDKIGVLGPAGDDVRGHDIVFVSPAGERLFSYTGAFVGTGFDWSPDGTWIISHYEGSSDVQTDPFEAFAFIFGVQFLRVANGQHFAASVVGPEGQILYQPSWRPAK